MPTDQNEHSVGPDHQFPAPPSHPQLPASKSGGHKATKIIVWLAILLVFAAAFYLVLHKKEEAKVSNSRSQKGGTVTVTATAAQKGDIGIYLDSIGTVTPVYTSSITSQVNGIVTAVHYAEGQMVRKGDPLIDIDPRPYQAQLVQAQGTLERDQNLLAQAKMDEERYQDAWNRRAIPKQTLDDQEKVVLQDQGTVKLDEGNVQYAQVELDFCHITAPITGRVGLRLVDPGNVVQSSGGLILAVITQVQPITVIFTISEDDLGQVQPQLRKKAKLAVEALDRSNQKHLASGTLLTLDNQIDTTTGTVKGRGMFANKDGALYPNQFVNTRLLVNTLKGVTLIPSSAIQQNGQTSFVYVLQDNVAHMRTITPGVTDRGTTQVTGINPGDQIATSSFEKLQDNSKVSITTGKPPASQNPTGSNAP